MIKTLIQNILTTRGAKFVSFTYLSKGAGELARHTLILGVDYHKLVEKSKLALELMPVSELVQNGVAPELAEQAKAKVLESLEKTLAAHAKGEQNEDYTKRDVYTSLGHGLQLNTNDNSLKIFGVSHAKVVLTPGTYKTVNSRPLTIATDKIKAMLATGKWREYCIDSANIKVAKMNGETLELE